MRFVIHVGRLMGEVLHFGFAARRLSLVLLILLGAVVSFLAVVSHAAAPLFVLYPFA